MDVRHTKHGQHRLRLGGYAAVSLMLCVVYARREAAKKKVRHQRPRRIREVSYYSDMRPVCTLMLGQNGVRDLAPFLTLDFRLPPLLGLTELAQGERSDRCR